MSIDILFLPGHGVELTGWKALQFELQEFFWNSKEKIRYFSLFLGMFKEISRKSMTEQLPGTILQVQVRPVW